MTHLGDLEVKVTDLEILCLSFWFKFLEIYLLNMLMDQVDTLLLVDIGDLEVKVTDLEILCLSFWFKFLEIYLLNMLMDQVDTLLLVDIGLTCYTAPS